MKRFEKYYGWIIAFVFCVAVIAVYKTFDNFNNITWKTGEAAKYIADTTTYKYTPTEDRPRTFHLTSIARLYP